MRFEDKFIGKNVSVNNAPAMKCVDVTNIMYLGEVLEFEDGIFYVLKQGDVISAID